MSIRTLTSVTFVVLTLALGSCCTGGAEGGTRLSNEMEPYALDYLEANGILEPGEEIVCYYDATIMLDGTEAAIVTDQRVIYHKDGNNSTMQLSEITDITHRKEGMIGDIFELTSESGQMFKIEVAPFNGGETFKSALTNAWENARADAGK